MIYSVSDSGELLSELRLQGFGESPFAPRFIEGSGAGCWAVTALQPGGKWTLAFFEESARPKTTQITEVKAPPITLLANPLSVLLADTFVGIDGMYDYQVKTFTEGASDLFGIGRLEAPLDWVQSRASQLSPHSDNIIVLQTIGSNRPRGARLYAISRATGIVTNELLLNGPPLGIHPISSQAAIIETLAPHALTLVIIDETSNLVEAATLLVDSLAHQLDGILQEPTINGVLSCSRQLIAISGRDSLAIFSHSNLNRLQLRHVIEFELDEEFILGASQSLQTIVALTKTLEVAVIRGSANGSYRLVTCPETLPRAVGNARSAGRTLVVSECLVNLRSDSSQ